MAGGAKDEIHSISLGSIHDNDRHLRKSSVRRILTGLLDWPRISMPMVSLAVGFVHIWILGMQAAISEEGSTRIYQEVEYTRGYESYPVDPVVKITAICAPT